MPTVIEKKNESSAALPMRERARLRKQFELHGVPQFALRLLSRKRASQAESDTTVRYRHD